MNRREAMAGIAGCGVALHVSTNPLSGSALNLSNADGATIPQPPPQSLEAKSQAAESLRTALLTCVQACDRFVARSRTERLSGRDIGSLQVAQCMECRERCRVALERVLVADVPAGSGTRVPAGSLRGGRKHSAAVLQVCADACRQVAVTLRQLGSVRAADCQHACQAAATACHEFMLS